MYIVMGNVVRITDFDMPELDVYARLTENQLLNRHEPEKGLFIAESPKVIERAINAGYIPVSFLVEEKHVYGEARDILAGCPDTPVYTAEFDVLTNLTGFKLTRGMLCAMRRPAMESVESVCCKADRIAILEDVVNPTNVGAIFRSGAALGIDAILLTAACTNPLYRRAIRVSMGTVFQLPWTIMDKNMVWPGGLDLIKSMGFKTVAFALTDNCVSIDNPELKAADKLAIVLGTEGEGLLEETIAKCDYTVKIPMSHGVDSLNVAAASAVAFWELRKR